MISPVTIVSSVATQAKNHVFDQEIFRHSRDGRGTFPQKSVLDYHSAHKRLQRTLCTDTPFSNIHSCLVRHEKRRLDILVRQNCDAQDCPFRRKKVMASLRNTLTATSHFLNCPRCTKKAIATIAAMACSGFWWIPIGLSIDDNPYV